MKKPLFNQKSPSLSVSEWVQGEATSLEQLLGNVVLVEVFQVNCPGCFLYSLPAAVAIHQQYSTQGLVVLGVATAFEDFNKNTLGNLKGLLEKGEVVGCRNSVILDTYLYPAYGFNLTNKLVAIARRC